MDLGSVIVVQGGKRELNFDTGAVARSGFNIDCPAQNSSSFVETLETHSAAEIGGRRFGLKALSIVLDDEVKMRRMLDGEEGDFCGFRVFEGVVEAFLIDAENVHLLILRAIVIQSLYPADYGDTGTRLCGFGHGFESRDKSEAVEAWRAEIRGNGADLTDSIRGEISDGGNSTGGEIGFFELLLGQLGRIFDDEKLLAESVVELAGDAFAFLFLGVDELLGEGNLSGLSASVSRDLHAIENEDEAANDQGAADPDRSELPPSGFNLDRGDGGFTIPLTVCRPGHDFELIGPRGESLIEGFFALINHLPSIIKSSQPNPKGGISQAVVVECSI